MTEESSNDNEPFSGILLKFTNVVKGWQYRFFVVDSQHGQLQYYLVSENRNKKPRGVLHLGSCFVVPSDDDQLSFTIVPVTGEGYKLKASDTRQKQEWINKIRLVSEQHSARIRNLKVPKPSKSVSLPEAVRSGEAKEIALLHNVYRMLESAAEQQVSLSRAQESLPMPLCLDSDLLMLKATSQALLCSLEHCATTLKRFQGVVQYPSNRSASSHYPSDDIETICVSQIGETVLPDYVSGSQQSLVIIKSLDNSDASEKPGFEVAADALRIGDEGIPVREVNTSDEVPDTDAGFVDPELGSVEGQKALILRLLSRLKLGMDLTRVPLPTFILQSHSLLETCSEFLANSDLFVAIDDQRTPEKRLLAVTKWYVSAFYFACKNGLARKPYNPLIGELFRCSWYPRCAKSDPVNFIAEQVSHHPPISAFYALCASKNIHLNCSIWFKSKFIGMSIGVDLIGEAVLYLGNYGETYKFSFPSVFGRSILTTPWIELGGRANITCEQTGLCSVITFHSKPFYGGKLHRISAEMKALPSADNVNARMSTSQQSLNNVLHAPAPVCKISGEWNGGLNFAFSDGAPSDSLDIGTVPKSERRIRPINEQHPRESRRLWHHVTAAIRSGDYDRAASTKAQLETGQREELARMVAFGGYAPHFFQQDDNCQTWTSVKMPPYR